MSLLGQIPASTKEAFLKKIADSVYNGNPLFNQLRENAIKYSGGRVINEPLMVAQNAGGRYSKFDVLNSPDNEIVDAAQYPWCQYYGAGALAGIDSAKNDGDAMVIDLLAAGMQGAGMTLAEKIAVDIYANSGVASTAATVSGAVTALDDICGTTATVGGLTSSDVALWAGQAQSVATTLALSHMEKSYLDCSEGLIHPDLIIGSKASYNKVFSLMVANQRYLGADKKAGFGAIAFNDAKLVFDSHVVDTTATDFTGARFYFLNTDFLHLSVHEKNNFRLEEKIPDNIDAETYFIYWYGNLTCNGRRFQGAAHNFS